MSEEVKSKRSRTGTTNRRKGVEWEQTIARVMRLFYPDARRNYQFDSATDDEPDITAGPWAIECKVGASPPPIKALKQARERAKGKDPLAVIKVNGTNRHFPKQMLVVCELEAFLELLANIYAVASTNVSAVLKPLRDDVQIYLNKAHELLSPPSTSKDPTEEQ